jgi:hypothetical protein
MHDEEHSAMGKVTETIAQLRASWRERGGGHRDTEIQTGGAHEMDHRRDVAPALIAELEALEVERSRIQSLLMTGGSDASDQIAALAERVERLRRELVADSSG